MAVDKTTVVPGSNAYMNIEDGLGNLFKGVALGDVIKGITSPTTGAIPKISWRSVNGVYKSGTIRFPVVGNNQQGQITMVYVQSETDGTAWCITALGALGEDADMADRTARGFVFK